MRIPRLPSALLAFALVLASLAAHAGRPLSPEDWYRFQAVSDVVIAPDGAAVAYLVTRYDQKSDESRAALWTANWAGTESVQLTHGESVSNPRFSPDGRYLSFLAARPAQAPTQLWLLDRRGGEARPVSHVSGEIAGYAWSPDGVHVALVMRAGDEPAGSPPKPIVIDALYFKQDKEGYLTREWRSHLYLLDIRSGAVSAVTSDPERVDSDPVFSPDGTSIAYLSNPVDAANLGRDQIWTVGTAAGAKPRALLTTDEPNIQRLQWSPDGSLLAFLMGDEMRFNAYITDRLAVADVRTGKVRVLTGSLDRAVLATKFAADGRSIEFAVEDDGQQYPARVTLADGTITRLAGPMVAHELAAAAGHTAVLSSSDHAPAEVFALEDGRLRPLSHHNAALFAELELGSVEDLSFRNKSGIEVHGQLIKPPGYVPGRRYPTILWIHGGPNGQDDHSLELWGYGPPLERQYFATHGYVVLAINYRGGSGRGEQFARSILADWGNKEVEDLLGGVDYAIAQGIADPKRLGVGGWSYGGILTDYLIASDPRFRAAISGAGSGNAIAQYGADEYLVEYNAELGPPWRNTALWLKVSYPLFHAERIRTPTLFMGGDKDFNVPISGGEQMYQALKTLGVPAQLVVYPGEYHALTRPSFLVDRSRRYLEWMDRYLKDKP